MSPQRDAARVDRSTPALRQAGAMGKVNNRKYLIDTRRNLRRDVTRAEALLWGALRKHRLSGRKFRRRYSIGPYVLDFHCPDMRLAAELDGSAHDHEAAQAHDRNRETYLARYRIRVLRFMNDNVETNLAGMVAEIEAVLDR